MKDSPITRRSLLLRIRNARDGQAWTQFVEIYAPLIHQYARRRGLQEADAADLVQEVLQTVSKTASRFEYDPERGSFRGWLFTVTRNRLLNFLEKRGREPQGTGDSRVKRWIDEHPDPHTEEARWTELYRWRVFTWASERIRGGFHDSTWQAFWRTAVERKPPKEVATELGMTIGAVYIARSRVLSRLRREVDEITED